MERKKDFIGFYLLNWGNKLFFLNSWTDNEVVLLYWYWGCIIVLMLKLYYCIDIEVVLLYWYWSCIIVLMLKLYYCIDKAPEVGAEVYLVSVDWVLDSQQYNEWLNEEDYELDEHGKVKVRDLLRVYILKNSPSPFLGKWNDFSIKLFRKLNINRTNQEIWTICVPLKDFFIFSRDQKIWFWKRIISNWVGMWKLLIVARLVWGFRIGFLFSSYVLTKMIL